MWRKRPKIRENKHVQKNCNREPLDLLSTQNSWQSTVIMVVENKWSRDTVISGRSFVVPRDFNESFPVWLISLYWLESSLRSCPEKLFFILALSLVASNVGQSYVGLQLRATIPGAALVPSLFGNEWVSKAYIRGFASLAASRRKKPIEKDGGCKRIADQFDRISRSIKTGKLPNSTILRSYFEWYVYMITMNMKDGTKGSICCLEQVRVF